MLKRLFIVCCLIAGASSLALAGDDVPSWLQQAAAAKIPVYDKDVPAVTLLKEEQVNVGADGRLTIVRTMAIKVLTREGRGYAMAAVPYLTDSGKVRDLHAWLIKPGGEVRRFSKDEVLDVISDPNDIYNELRVKTVVAKDAADAGAVFGFQATSEERSIFGEDTWSFQDRLPALTSRFSVTLPAGWSARGLTFNHAKIDPQVAGTTYTWELDNLVPIRPEPASPQVTNLAPRLAISYAPPDNALNGPMRTFGNWTDVSRFVSELHDPQAAPDDALTAKARELTANAKTDLDRIRAIGQYVQHLQYISIDIGVGHGGGIRPHAASQVFAKSYGDCKDKATLMRAMLKSVGMVSYPVAIYLGDRNYVREEWASPSQFNHCIIAISVGDETKAPTVIQHRKLGRLLIFDSTDDDTPVGDLPDEEQGSWALIIAGDSGALVRMPVTPPEANRLERQSELTLTSDGSLMASVRERSIGQSAVEERRKFRHLTRPEYTKQIEKWITRGAAGAKVSKIEPADNNANGQFALDVDFAVGGYAQVMQERLMVFKPAAVSRLESLFLTDASREQPVVLGPYAFDETVRVKLPSGFQVDEMPDAIKLDTPFGSYVTSYEAKDGQLLFTRKLVQRSATIPVERYNSVRNFYERIRAAEQAPVVLMRK
jgi:Domain of Unknown Function with PDB structure (DUF3857)/Transglutaminase-like superfamily